MSKDREEDQLLESNYDGIQEYDNDLPKWWLYLFLICILFGLFYVGYYQFGPGQSEQPHARLARQMNEYKELRSQVEESQAAQQPDAQEILSLANNEEMLNHGKEVFATNCVACHLDKAQGLVGPNLTDQYWIHGGKFEDIQTIIKKGVIEKGMLAWEGVLKPDDLRDVTLYIWSLRNTNVEGKAPEGELVED